MAKSSARSASTGQFLFQTRQARVVAAASEAGFLAGGRSAIGARVPRHLIDAAKARTGLTSTTEILEYALAKVALEDDFGAALVARKGRAPRDLDLEL
ncbi:hypothetical protein [Phenylobacterium sp.]|uniref:hypothetical protein n=1 Tax=Phenylobacterium sp. TaxID=1871053 RepID=UPI0025DB39AA|nr:hypothetical protein [Phenylobacterium sp.]